MNAQVFCLLEVVIQPGREAEFRALVGEIVAATRADEPGTLDYEWSISADGTRAHLVERYVDSAAVLAHLANFMARFAERFLAVVTPGAFTIYGAPSDAVKGALANFNPVYLEPVGGFSR